MSAYALTRLLRLELEREVKLIEEGLVNGHITSMEEYRSLSGKRLGFMQALAIIDETSRRFDEQN